jgi:integrase
VSDLAWKEIDDPENPRVWSLTAERVKGNEPHLVPLAPMASDLIRQLPRWHRGDFAFTTREGRDGSQWVQQVATAAR